MLEATGFVLIVLYLLGMMSSEILWSFLQILVVLSVGLVLLRSVHKPASPFQPAKVNATLGLALGRSNV